MSHADALVQRFQLEFATQDGLIPQWFHGIISRKLSEELLMCKPPGHFLIRVSESRFGYTLSYRADDGCRHFMIDALEDGYVILGDDRHHRLLQNLVDFHCRHPIRPFTELLTVPCGQISDIKTDDHEEMFFSQRHQMIFPSNTVDPPALPWRPNIPPSETLHDAQTVSAPRFSQPKLPHRNADLAPSNDNPFHIRTKCGLPSFLKNQRDPLRSVFTNLKKIKKNSKNCTSEKSVFEEIQSNADVNPEKNLYQVNRDPQSLQAENLDKPAEIITLPQEYLPPPPFAPGYKFTE
ncbi:unnamed protein product [Knipowitschia caucasica]